MVPLPPVNICVSFQVPFFLRAVHLYTIFGMASSIMPIGDDQIAMGGAPFAQIMQQTRPAIFVLLSAGPQR